MKNSNLEKDLYQMMGQKTKPRRLEETIKGCVEIMHEKTVCNKEVRTSFFQYLSDVLRFEGMPIVVMQAVALFFVCVTIAGTASIPQDIPVFIPLFVLAVMPVIFKSQMYGMSEIEAVTRASGAQIMLAKLVLAGTANLICITIVLFLEVSIKKCNTGLGQMVMYCLVPYLICMIGMLRMVRLQRREGIWKGTIVMFSFSFGFAVSLRILPWLYEASAISCWLIAFVVFGVFFVKEILFIVEMRKEGKMYGVIA